MHLGHASYVVKDLGRTLDFYCRGLGFKEHFTMKNDAGELTTAYVKINDREFLEFFPGKDDVGLNNGSYRHLCLHVEDLESELAVLAQRGLTAESPVTRGKAGSLQTWLTDPEGNRIELMQLMPDSLHLKQS